LFNLKSKVIALNENTAYLGGKRVEINKLTPKKWRELFETVDQLPGLVVKVLLAPKEDFYAYAVSAGEIAMGEVVRVVAVLSELDEEFIDENVGLDELIDYLAKTAKKNNFGSVVKNVKSLLPKTAEQ
jgi:hypothetical protein